MSFNSGPPKQAVEIMFSKTLYLTPDANFKHFKMSKSLNFKYPVIACDVIHCSDCPLIS